MAMLTEPVSMTSDVESLDFEAGELFLVDKPMDWTSFDVVHRVRDLFHVKKVGHAGTLDPKATGLLILCTGKRTKEIDEFTGKEKEYEGILQLGSTTASFDSETPIEDMKEFHSITEENMVSMFHSFLGEQSQLPPMYSAVKHSGKPLYKYARKGRSVERTPRDIEIMQFEMVSFQLPFVEFRIVCSKGTYIRSLVSDCGDKLGCGAFLKELRRTRIGEFSVRDALTIEDLHVLAQKCAPRRSLQEA